MTPHAVEQAERLLKAFPADPPSTGFCQPAPFSLLATAATWPDDLRATAKEKGGRPETEGWHYIDYPIHSHEKDPRAFCKGDKSCVLEAVEKQLAILRQPGESKEKADALRFVIHFVGDLHQPLHSGDNGDEGGNCVPIAYYAKQPELRGRTPEQQAHGNYSPNLHSVWDTDILKHLMAGASVPEFVRSLEPEVLANRNKWGKGDPADWVRESRKIAGEVVYGKLLPSPREDRRLVASLHEDHDVAQCSDDNLSKRALDAHLKIDDRYQRIAEPVVKEQIEKAAIRLARLLNGTWE